VLTEQPGSILAYLSFNCEDPALSKREVRQALAYATDRETLVRTLLRGQARVAEGLCRRATGLSKSNTQRYAYDPARAEALLDQAGLSAEGRSAPGHAAEADDQDIH